jgi:hypothetical protein
MRAIPNEGTAMKISRSLALVAFVLLAATHVHAQGQLGTVSDVESIICGTGGLSAGGCYQLTISCPSVADQNVDVKINQPIGLPIGTVTFITGAGGDGDYDVSWTYSLITVSDVLAAGYTTAQLSWSTAPPYGWLTGPGGIKALACRPATAAQWVQTQYPSSAACATGTSGGAAALAYAIDNYGVNFNFAELSAGPVFSRVDWGCDGVQPDIISIATGRLTSWDYGMGSAVDIDQAYTPNTYCATELADMSTEYDYILLPDSVMFPGANYSFSTPTHFVYGGLDLSASPLQGYVFEQALGSTHAIVADASHAIEDLEDGAEKIASDLISSCNAHMQRSLNFGQANVGTAATVLGLAYNFTSDITLSAVSILTGGAPNGDFEDGEGSTCIAGTSYTAGQSCTVEVSFTPSAPGLRVGAIKLYAQGQSLPLATFYINGTGESSEVTIDPGTQTSLGSLGGTTPAGLAIDGAGNAYVSDATGKQVIEIAAGTQTKTTVITGLSAPKGLAVDGSGNLYIANSGSGQVVVVPSENGTLNAADQYTVGTGLTAPYGVAVDGAGDVYIADYAAGQIVEVAANGVQTDAVTGLTNPAAIAVDGAGDIFVSCGNLVTEYPVGSQTGTPVGSGFQNVTGLGLDPSGTVYVADQGAGKVYEVTPGAVQTTLPTSGLNEPSGVVFCATNVYISDASGALYNVNRALPIALVFPNEQIGNASPAQAVTVSNVGNQQLMASSLAIPTNFIQVPSGGTDCSSSTQLNVSLTCQIAIEFDPTGTGRDAGYVTLTDNALNNSASTQSVAVVGNGAKESQTITFTINAPSSATYATSFNVAATASSGLTVAFTASGVCTVVDNLNGTAMYTMTRGTGTCTVTANQTGNGIYQAAPQVTESTTAALATPTVTFTGAPATAAFHVRFMVSAITNASTSATITASGVCTIISGGTNSATVKITSGTGTCSMAANWPADSNYTAASASQSTSAVMAAAKTTITSKPNPSTEGENVEFSATVAGVNQGTTYPTGTVTFKALSGKFTRVVTLSRGTASFSTTTLPEGTLKFEAVYSGDANFAASTSKVLTQVVNE